MIDKKNLRILAIALLSLFGAITLTYGSYLIISNTINVSVTPQATLSLASNATNLISGVSCIQLNAHVSDNSPGLTVTFFQDSVMIGTAATDANGNAIYVTPILTASHSYYAETTHP